ncbi:hypothetical protein BZM26_37760 [Paraburkholderia strydomiana]|nr:hypothetical protein BZM26_37760 [Paraburkholderia strydomiana]
MTDLNTVRWCVPSRQRNAAAFAGLAFNRGLARQFFTVLRVAFILSAIVVCIVHDAKGALKGLLERLSSGYFLASASEKGEALC